MTTDDLVVAAVGILEDYGLGDLSMRRVAAELGVQASALYWHVQDKQSLLAMVADRLLGRVEVPGEVPGDAPVDAPVDAPGAVPPARTVPGADWAATVRARALALHATLLETRDAAELVASVVALGTGGRRLRELIAAPLRGVERDGAGPDVEVLTDAVVSLLLGSALISQQRAQAGQLGLDVNGAGTPTTGFAAQLDLLLALP